MEKIISLCKRRGFVFPSCQIYGGFSSSYDFGPLGVELKRNIKNEWWKAMVHSQNNIVGLDSAILMTKKVWEASGHLTAGFADELVECKKCHKRFKLDEIKNQKCPECKGKLTEPRKFNLMMKTFVGPLEDESSLTYLRAQTCQGIYLNFKNVLQTMRLKIPFGIAQIGKAFRNEITPKNFIFRTREFEQMEMQYFVKEKEAKNFFEYWKNERLNWYLKLGMKRENLRLREVPQEQRAHYAKKQVDIEYHFPFGWQEIEGIHNRGDWDLKQHQKFSGQDLSYFDEKTKKRFLPHIIETSVGVERCFLAFLIDSFTEIKGGRAKKSKKEVEIVLRLNFKLAPIKIAILPLVKNKPEIVKKAKEIYRLLKADFMVQYDEVGSIGRRYRRQDEQGTPWAITVDFKSLEKNDVTVRDRDTMEQERIKICDLRDYFEEKLRD